MADSNTPDPNASAGGGGNAVIDNLTVKSAPAVIQLNGTAYTAEKVGELVAKQAELEGALKQKSAVVEATARLNNPVGTPSEDQVKADLAVIMQASGRTEYDINEMVATYLNTPTKGKGKAKIPDPEDDLPEQEEEEIAKLSKAQDEQQKFFRAMISQQIRNGADATITDAKSPLAVFLTDLKKYAGDEDAVSVKGQVLAEIEAQTRLLQSERYKKTGTWTPDSITEDAQAAAQAVFKKYQPLAKMAAGLKQTFVPLNPVDEYLRTNKPVTVDPAKVGEMSSSQFRDSLDKMIKDGLYRAASTDGNAPTLF